MREKAIKISISRNMNYLTHSTIIRGVPNASLKTGFNNLILQVKPGLDYQTCITKLLSQSLPYNHCHSSPKHDEKQQNLALFLDKDRGRDPPISHPNAIIISPRPRGSSNAEIRGKCHPN